MELDDYLRALSGFEPEREKEILNLYAILGYFIGGRQWIAAKTIEAAINEVRNNLAAEIAENVFENESINEDEIPF